MNNLIGLEKAIFSKNTDEITKILSTTKLFSDDNIQEHYKHLTIILRRLIRANDIRTIKLFVEHSLNLQAFTTPEGKNLLLVACEMATDVSHGLLEYLAHECSEHINTPDPETGFNPLATMIIHSTYDKYIDRARLLINLGASVRQDLFLRADGEIDHEPIEFYIHKRLLELAQHYKHEEEKGNIFKLLATQFSDQFNVSALKFSEKVTLLYQYDSNSAEFKAIINAATTEVSLDANNIFLAKLYIIASRNNHDEICIKIIRIIQQKSFEDKLFFCEHVADKLYHMNKNHKELTTIIMDESWPETDDSDQHNIRYYAFLFARLYSLGLFEICMGIEDVVWELDDIDKLIFVVALMQVNTIYSDHGATAINLSDRRDKLGKRFILSISPEKISANWQPNEQDEKLKFVNYIEMYLYGVDGAKEKLIEPLKRLTQPKLHVIGASVLGLDPTMLLFGGALRYTQPTNVKKRDLVESETKTGAKASSLDLS